MDHLIAIAKQTFGAEFAICYAALCITLITTAVIKTHIYTDLFRYIYGIQRLNINHTLMKLAIMELLSVVSKFMGEFLNSKVMIALQKSSTEYMTNLLNSSRFSDVKENMWRLSRSIGVIYNTYSRFSWMLPSLIIRIGNVSYYTAIIYSNYPSEFATIAAVVIVMIVAEISQVAWSLYISNKDNSALIDEEEEYIKEYDIIDSHVYDRILHCDNPAKLLSRARERCARYQSMLSLRTDLISLSGEFFDSMIFIINLFILSVIKLDINIYSLLIEISDIINLAANHIPNIGIITRDIAFAAKFISKLRPRTQPKQIKSFGMIRFTSLYVKRDKFELVWDMPSLIIKRSQPTLTMIIGSSGSGKTTIMETMAGIFTDAKYSLWVDGRLSKWTQLIASRHIVEQISSVGDMQETWANFISSNSAAPDTRAVRTAMWCVCLDGLLRIRYDDDLDAKIEHLSGGELRRAKIAIGMYRYLTSKSRANILFIDEPDAGLDRLAVDVVGRIKQIHAGNIIITAHDESIIPLADIVLRCVVSGYKTRVIRCK